MESLSRAVCGTIACTVLAVLVLATPASAGFKPYTVSITPGDVAAGSSQSFSAKVSNLSTAQALGAVDLTVPAGFALTGAGLPAASQGTASTSGSTAQFRDLAIAPGTSRVLTVSADVGCDASSGRWSVAAKQANDFNGTGNDFDLVGARPLTAVGGACSLSFVQQPPPATGTGDTFPLSVELLNGANMRATGSTAEITLSLVQVSGAAGSLSGATSATAEQGLAGFSVGLHGADQAVYAIRAESGASSTTSDEVTVHRAATRCAENQEVCTASSTLGGTTFAMDAPAEDGEGNDATTLTIDWDIGLKPDCSYGLGLPYTELADHFAVFDAGQRSVHATLTLAGELMQQAPLGQGLEFCYAGPSPFAAKAAPNPIGVLTTPSTLDAEGFFFGILPDCGGLAEQIAPCVVSRSTGPGGAGIITVDLLEGDPKGIG